MNMYDVKESDWKLLRKLVPDWQERYMDKLNKEYIEILSRECNPSTNSSLANACFSNSLNAQYHAVAFSSFLARLR